MKPNLEELLEMLEEATLIGYRRSHDILLLVLFQLYPDGVNEFIRIEFDGIRVEHIDVPAFVENKDDWWGVREKHVYKNVHWVNVGGDGCLEFSITSFGRIIIPDCVKPPLYSTPISRVSRYPSIGPGLTKPPSSNEYSQAAEKPAASTG